MLMKPESEQIYKQRLIKASEKLDKAFTEPDIRFLVDGLLQKNSVDMYITIVFWIYMTVPQDISYLLFNFFHYNFRAKRDARREEKLLLKQLEQKRRGIENESNGIISEMQREMLASVSICCFYCVIWCLMVQVLTCIGIL